MQRKALRASPNSIQCRRSLYLISFYFFVFFFFWRGRGKIEQNEPNDLRLNTLESGRSLNIKNQPGHKAQKEAKCHLLLIQFGLEPEKTQWACRCCAFRILTETAGWYSAACHRWKSKQAARQLSARLWLCWLSSEYRSDFPPCSENLSAGPWSLWRMELNRLLMANKKWKAMQEANFQKVRILRMCRCAFFA